MAKINPIKAKYGDEKRWVNYRLEEVKGKMTKVPYSISGKHASSTDPKTWATLKECFAVSKQVGIVFTPAQNLLGVDIDHCLNADGKIEHESQEKIEQLLAASKTYVEVSPSGTGLHLYFALSEPMALTANRHGNFEAYTSGRYFTVTGRAFGDGDPNDIREIDEMEAISLLSIIGYPWGKEKILSEPEIKKDTPPSLLSNVDDATVVTRMFGSKNGSEIKALFDGDLSRHGKDHSKADMALCAHLAFWTGKNAEQMERIWMSSPLGTREKTHTRPDYRRSTISSAISKCKNVYESQEERMAKEQDADEEHVRIDFLYTINAKKDIVYVLNTENICRALRGHPEFKDKFRFDAFKNVLEYHAEKGGWRELKDNDSVDVQTRISVLFPIFSKVGKEMVTDAIVKVSHEMEIDSAADYFRALVWDQEKRLDSWLSTVYGTPDDVYHHAVASNWLKGLVKRAMHPGCKFDYVLVLEGMQGIKKSTSLGVLGGSWHVETTMATDNKDFFMQFQGKLIVEFSEGETLSRTEVKRLKAVITTPTDKYRPPYGKLSIDVPRRCVFAMTTNQSEYLKDETGNRRWLPVEVLKTADVEWLEKNRDQLFAEAYHRVITLGETTYQFPEEETLLAQEMRRIKDPNAEIIADWYYNVLKPQDRENGITVHQAYRDVLCGGFVHKPLDKYTEMAIANVYTTILRLNKIRRMVEGQQAMRWFSGEKTPTGFISSEPKDALDVLF